MGIWPHLKKFSHSFFKRWLPGSETKIFPKSYQNSQTNQTQTLLRKTFHLKFIYTVILKTLQKSLEYV
jgi:hypothetical protein